MIPQSQSTREVIRLRTGQGDCRLLFQARQYQLRPQGSDQRIELGYAGSRVLERLLRSPGEKRKSWADLVLAMQTFDRLSQEKGPAS